MWATVVLLHLRTPGRRAATLNAHERHCSGPRWRATPRLERVTLQRRPGHLHGHRQSRRGQSLATSTVVDGLTNGVEYTFTVQAFNSAGASESSAPSNPVTPRAYTLLARPRTAHASTAHPPPPEEVYLPSEAVQRQNTVPCRPEMGTRMGFFIEDAEVRPVPGVRVVG